MHTIIYFLTNLQYKTIFRGKFYFPTYSKQSFVVAQDSWKQKRKNFFLSFAFFHYEEMGNSIYGKLFKVYI